MVHPVSKLQLEEIVVADRVLNNKLTENMDKILKFIIGLKNKNTLNFNIDLKLY